MQVMKELPHFHKLIQESIDDNDESEDIAKGLARVFAEVGEAYVGLIAAGMHTCADRHSQCQHGSGCADSMLIKTFIGSSYKTL
jgi:hypothetical protein